MRTKLQRLSYLMLSLMLVVSILSVQQPAAATSNVPLSSLSLGDTVNFGGYTWRVLNPSTGYLIMQGFYNTRAFDPNNTKTFDLSDTNNIGYYLNTTFYNSLDSDSQALIQSHSWGIGYKESESSATITCKIGLMSYNEWGSYKATLGDPSSYFWTITPDSGYPNYVWGVSPYGARNLELVSDTRSVRPALYLNPGAFVSIPTIATPVCAGATSVSGTSVANANISLTINGGTAKTVTADANGDWVVSGLTLAAGNSISVTAQKNGTVSQPVTVTVTAPVTGIGAISGKAQVGSELTAGALTPVGAAASYQWQESATSDGSYTPIAGATSGTYTPTADDAGKYIEVVANGTGNYTGTVTSAPTGPVTTAITGIGAISGKAQVGSELTAGALTPAGGVASYQWQESATSDGSYTPIAGATSGTYTPTADDAGKYIEVVATGTGNYSGTITSAPTGPVTALITGIGAISGKAQVGGELTAGALTPAGAAASYQWQESAKSDGSYTPIAGATSGSYTPTADDLGKYIEVVATGTGNYTGTATSAPSGPVTAPVTGIGAISGKAQVGSELTAGALTPAGGVASYQWQESATSDGSYTPIAGATSGSYTPTADDLGKYIKVVATGTGNYTGTATSASTGPVTTAITGIGAISGKAQVGSELTAGALTPVGATASYQWQESAKSDGSYTPIAGATSGSYTPTADDLGKYIEVVETGTGNYTGTATSAPSGPVTAPVTGIGAISGKAQVGSELAAGALTPAGGVASYQWQESATSDGSYTPIAGATSNTYTPTADDLGKYIDVVATGTGNYTGTVTSAPSGPVTAPVTGIGAISGKAQVGSELTAGALTPAGGVASYQWQESATSDGSYTPIAGATSNTYTPTADDAGKYIEVVATGTGNYSGMATSAPTGPVIALPPTFTTQPTSRTVTAGQTATFSIVATGDTISYQWQISTDSGNTWNNITGATSTSYTTGALAKSNSGSQYRCEVTNKLNGTMATANSSAATLTVNPALVITEIGLPQGTVGASYNSNALNATGGVLPYTWSATGLPSGLNINKLTGAVYGTPKTSGISSVQISVTDSVNACNSKNFSLTVYPVPSITQITPSSGPTTGGTSVTITGTGLSTVSAVYFGSTAAKSFSLGTDTLITAVSPAGTGKVNVTVYGPGGTSATNSNGLFTYLSSSGGGSRSIESDFSGYHAIISGIDKDGKDIPEITSKVTVNKSADDASINLDSALGDTIKVGGKIVISIPSIPKVNSFTVGIPVEKLSTTGGDGMLTVKTDMGSLTLPSNMLTSITGTSGKTAEISIGLGNKSNLAEAVKAAIGDRPVIQLSLNIGGKRIEWNNPAAPVKISIPYTPIASELTNPEAIVIWYIDGNGNAVSVPNAHYDVSTGTVTFTITHFSYYAVGYSKVNFNDVAETAWYSHPVSFIAAREITTGTGAGNFSPQAGLTRADFLVMMLRAYGIKPDTDMTNNFSDAGNSYYTPYLSAAKKLGISDGIGENRFAPDKKITRQEMFTMLYHVLKTVGQLPSSNTGNQLSSYHDAGDIAPWSKEAMTLLVNTGTVSGNNGKLTPVEPTTRAQMAQVLYNLLSK